MKHADFVHLHNHTEYSLLDGAISIDKLVKTAAAMNMAALAITDHGNMYGAIRFYQAAMKNGIKPIIGCEFYVAPDSRLNKTSQNGISDAAFHLTLLAQNLQGYKNLLELSTLSFLEGFYYRPRVDKEILAKYSKGLIALSGCLKGEIAQTILSDNLEKTNQVMREYTEIFGQENFYLEIMDHNLEHEHKVIKTLVEIADHQKIGLVATNDTHYLKKEDAFAHEALMAIGTGKRMTNEDRMRLTTEEFYFKSPQEMAKIFSQIPQACKNTMQIMEKCNLELNFAQVSLPAFAVPEGHDLDTYLENLCRDGVKKRYGRSSVEIDKRLEHELSVIKKMGYSAYFLIVWDFIHYAKTHGIPVGPGRGSGAGSLVAYSLEITDIDPLRYGLIFERFLNADRISMPDLDIDFSDAGREEVINYVRQKYGEKNVSQIITFGTLGARLVVRDVARVLDIPLDEADRLAKLIPSDPGITLAEALKSNPELKQAMGKNNESKQLFQISNTLEGLTRHSSKHAAGIVITREELTNYVPLCKNSKGDITTQYDGDMLVKMGLLKVDFLGLRTLTVIDSTCRILVQDRQINIDIGKIPLDDKETYELLSHGQTLGIFQLDSSGMRDLVRKLQPTAIEDVIALIALYRPGPMGSGMLDDFVGRKHGKIPVKYDLPSLEPILKETYGIIVYQEQVMQIAMAVAGFTAGQADLLRRAMGKKDPLEMEKQRKIFLEGAAKRKVKAEKANKLFDLMDKFAGYGFNKSHAAAYAYLAYQTAFLKTHYPLEFMSALLTSEIGNQDDIVIYIEEAKDMGIQILPPHINASVANFRVKDKAIRFGLAAVKNVGSGAIDSIVAVREQDGEFKSLYDFCSRVDLRTVNKRVIESLIKCGALDGLGRTRMEMFDQLEMVMQRAQSLQQDVLNGQTSFLDMLPVEDLVVSGTTKEHHREWHENKLLEHEREVLGFYMTGHPLARFAEELNNYTTSNLQDIVNLADKQAVRVGGIIKKVKMLFTRKNDRMAVFALEDLKGELPVVVFPDQFSKSEVTNLIRTDQTVIVCGQLDKRRAEPQVILDKILPLEQARERLTESIHINIKTIGLEQDVLQKIKSILLKYPGVCPVFLHLATAHSGEIMVTPGAAMRVAASTSFLLEIEGILGKSCVLFKA